MAMHPVEDKFVGRFNGPSAITGWCKICNFGHVTRKPPEGRRGRGWGMREGNKLRGLLIQHVKERHPDLYGETMAEAKEERRLRCEALSSPVSSAER